MSVFELKHFGVSADSKLGIEYRMHAGKQSGGGEGEREQSRGVTSARCYHRRTRRFPELSGVCPDVHARMAT